MVSPTEPVRIPRFLFWGLAGLLLVAFAIRLAAAHYWQDRLGSEQTFAWGDSKTYWQIAENMVHDGDYSFGSPPKRIFRAPGYCGLLAVEMQLSETLLQRPFSITAARWTGAALGTFAIALMGCWVWTLTRSTIGSLLTVAGLAIYPGGIAMSVFVLAEAMFIPVMVLALWTWSQALQQQRWGQVLAWSLVAGLMNGQAILIRPSWLLFPPLVSLLLLACFGQRSRTFLSAVVVGLGIIVAMTPWWYRNYQLTDRFVPTTLQVGASLYDGWNPQADGSSDMSHGYRIEEEVRQSVLTQGIENNWTDQEIAMQQELAANDRLSQAARVWANEHPWQLVKLFFVKVGRTWRPWPIADEASSPAMQWLVGASMVLILIFAVPQLFRAFQAPAWMLLFFPTVYYTVLHGVFVGSIRYRQPAVFLLVPFAAIGFHLTCRWLLSSRSNTTDTGKDALHKKTATQG